MTVHSARAAIPALDELISLARRRTTKGKRADPAAALSEAVFKDFGLRAALPPLTVDKTALPMVLEKRRGACVGLVSVYLALAEALHVTCSAVLVPEHLFLRVRRADGGVRNVETLRAGASKSDGWYRRRHAVPKGVTAYMRDLSPREFRGVVAYNLGNALRRARRRKLALRAYTEATELFPDFPEAHANRGLLLYLLGKHSAASAAFDRAATLHPTLPGLRENRALVRRALKRRPR